VAAISPTATSAPATMPAGRAACPRPRVVLIDKADQTQAFVRLGDVAIARADADFDILGLGNYVLGGAGLVSRITDHVRTRRGLAYSAGSSLIERRLPGPFVARTITRNDAAVEATRIILAEVERLRQQPIPAAELDAAKAQFTGSLPFKLETNAQKAWAALYGAVLGLGPDFLERQIERLRAAAPEEVRAAAERRLNATAPLIVAVAPRALAAAFAPLGEVTVLAPDAVG
jgi:zinc protease